jgi:hypothetical protein
VELPFCRTRNRGGLKKLNENEKNKVFQGFKGLRSLSSVWLFISFNLFFFAVLLWFALFHYFDWASLICLDYRFFFRFRHAPSIWVSWALLAFGFLAAFSSLLIIEISFTPSMRCDLYRGFLMKENLFRLKKRPQGINIF